MDASCIAGNNPESSVLFWSLSEAREGSTVIEFVLQYWELAAGIGVYKFILDYPKLSDGIKRIKCDITPLLADANVEKASTIMIDNVAQELKKIREERD